MSISTMIEEPPKNEAERFGTWCALTCLGGSEKKQCPCTCAHDCQLQLEPAFPEWRKKSIERLFRVGLGVDLRWL